MSTFLYKILKYNGECVRMDFPFRNVDRYIKEGPGNFDKLSFNYYLYH